MSDQNSASPPRPAADIFFTSPLDALAASTRPKATVTPPKSTRYVDLGNGAPENSHWLNDPSYMKLETYFPEDQKAAPGLATSFSLKGLKPVLVKPDTEEGNTYLITDGKSYWIFNELDESLWKFKNTSLTQTMVVNLVEEERYDGRDLTEQLPARQDADSG